MNDYALLTDRQLNVYEIRGNENNRIYQKTQGNKGIKVFMGIPNSATRMILLDFEMQKLAFSHITVVYSLN